MSRLLEARQLRHSYDDGRVEALRGIDFTLDDGEFVAIQGPSGCGKSTLLRMLGALDEPSGGEMLFRGEPFDWSGDLSRFRSRTLGFIFQSFHLLPTLSALENVQIPMFERRWSVRDRRRRALALLEAVDLADRAGHLPSKLSGGERQRVAIARSLANEPAMLLADEPTGNLDSENTEHVLDMLAKVHARHGTALVVVTHDPSVSARANRVVQMLDGRVTSDGPPSPRRDRSASEQTR